VPKQKVALVLSGGTSLGAYIAGALDELMQAFSAARDRYEIDIITGASAGATTTALIAHGLLYRGGQTALHDVWVDKLDIVELLDPGVPADEPPTILSNRRLREVAQEQIAWKPAGGAGERAPFCAERLTLAMTIANVTPLPYLSRIAQPTGSGIEEFVQYRHAEQETFFLDAGIRPDDPHVWPRIARVAQASAAIPLVFPLVQLSRQAENPAHYIQRPNFHGEARFWYFDGGTFNNLPVDLAWHYMQQNTSSADPLEGRVVLVINPWRSDATVSDMAPPRPGVFTHALGLLAALRQESSAIQFQHEVIARSRSMQFQSPREAARALPGVDPAPVELLGTFALVMPRRGDGRLRGNHLNALGAFLDQRFREYDFRRGAADARRVASERLGIQYTTGRAEDFYRPDGDPSLQADLSSYDCLGRIPSTREPGRSVQAVFERALERRIDALLARWDAPGPDFVLDPVLSMLVKRYAHEHLPDLWL
jgi:predicted acylesterase/phospholipase RssA